MFNPYTLYDEKKHIYFLHNCEEVLSCQHPSHTQSPAPIIIYLFIHITPCFPTSSPDLWVSQWAPLQPPWSFHRKHKLLTKIIFHLFFFFFLFIKVDPTEEKGAPHPFLPSRGDLCLLLSTQAPKLLVLLLFEIRTPPPLPLSLSETVGGKNEAAGEGGYVRWWGEGIRKDAPSCLCCI